MDALIIPVYIKTETDRESLKRLLLSVIRQTLPFGLVIVIDDASPLDYSLQSFDVLHVRLPENGGPARARNRGIAMALAEGSEFLFFTDHDCILDAKWHERMVYRFETTDYGALGGMTKSWGKTLFDYYHDVNGTLCGKWLLPGRAELWYAPSLNFAMRAEVVRRFNFDEKFPTAAGEDVDICLRLRSMYRIGFCPDACLWHDYGYTSNAAGLFRFIRLFMKYKSSSATLYEGHTVLLWDASESIYEGNMHEPHL